MRVSECRGARIWAEDHAFDAADGAEDGHGRAVEAVLMVRLRL